MRAYFLLAVLAASAGLQPLRSWDGQGHMMVAWVAFQHLDAATRAKVVRLLRLHPDYNTWVAGIPDDEAHRDQRLQRAMMLAATWPDEIKQDPHYTNDGENPNGRPAAAQNIGYADHLQHRYWHYIDVPLAVGGAQGRQPASVNAQERIELFLAALRTPPSPGDNTLAALQSYDLVWLLHLVGDIHQPLHCTSRFTPALPAGDAGGNKVKVKPTRATHDTELHSYWDRRLGASNDPDTVAKAAGRLPSVSRASASNRVSAWVRASWSLARNTVYCAPIGDAAGPYPLTAAYEQKALTTARKQVALAGARLAKVLAATLP